MIRRSIIPPFSKVFSTAAWPIKAKFQIVLQWDGGRKVCSWTPGHINKMAATPIYGKSPSKIFSRTKDERPWNFVHLFSIWDSSASQVVEMMTCSGKRKIVQMVFVTVSRWQFDLNLIYFKVNFCSLYVKPLVSWFHIKLLSLDIIIGNGLTNF